MVRSGTKLYLGFEDCIQIRDEKTGELLHTIENVPAFNLDANENYIWVVSITGVLVINIEVRKREKKKLYYIIFLEVY